jgi:hypothetical protein
VDPDLDPEIALRLKTVLQGLDLVEGMLAGRWREVGWWMDDADDPSGKKTMRFFKITSVTRQGECLVATYDYKSGVMELRQKGQVLSGPWREGERSGEFEFSFDQAGKFLSGRWNSFDNPKEWNEAVLR